MAAPSPLGREAFGFTGVVHPGRRLRISAGLRQCSADSDSKRGRVAQPERLANPKSDTNAGGVTKPGAGLFPYPGWNSVASNDRRRAFGITSRL
jgi:hypothetical protein